MAAHEHAALSEQAFSLEGLQVLSGVLVIHHRTPEGYVPRVFADMDTAEAYYATVGDEFSRALYDQRGVLRRSWFYDDNWRGNIEKYRLSLRPREQVCSGDYILNDHEKGLLLAKSEQEWIAASRKDKFGALARFPVHKLLCGPRHEYHFLHEGPGRRQILETMATYSGQPPAAWLTAHPERGVGHSRAAHLFVNVLGRDDAQGRFVVDKINLMDGNRRAVSLTLAYLRGLVPGPGGTPPTLGDLKVHPLFNGRDKAHAGPYECWIPARVICHARVLVDDTPRGEDRSRALRTDVGFDSEYIALADRGRPIGFVAGELQRLYTA
jgi:hypothetical protein